MNWRGQRLGGGRRINGYRGLRSSGQLREEGGGMGEAMRAREAGEEEGERCRAARNARPVHIIDQSQRSIWHVSSRVPLKKSVTGITVKATGGCRHAERRTPLLPWLYPQPPHALLKPPHALLCAPHAWVESRPPSSTYPPPPPRPSHGHPQRSASSRGRRQAIDQQGVGSFFCPGQLPGVNEDTEEDGVGLGGGQQAVVVLHGVQERRRGMRGRGGGMVADE
ncbi:unnamed protein product [Closterium sp. Yama58-4]|nr:unnamed protein product [Closterium sp. Yama58-4]